MAGNEVPDIKNSASWSIISKFCIEEKNNKQNSIMGILKSDNCTENSGKTLADIKEHIGQIKALEKILELPDRLKKVNREKE